MNRISKQFVLILILICAWNVNKAQIKVGIQAGVNFSNVTVKDANGNKSETGSVPGIRIGLLTELPIASDFFIQPGIFYAKKGFKQETGGYYGLAQNFEVKTSYVELPVNLLYKPSLGTGKLLLGAGPYISYGAKGTWKSDNVILIGDIMTDAKGEITFENDYMDGEFGRYTYGKPWDYGLNFLAGYEFPIGFSIQINAQTGVANLQPESGGEKPDGSLRNRSFGLSAGYRF